MTLLVTQNIARIDLMTVAKEMEGIRTEAVVA
jgi:hypothetical protein